MPLEIFSIEMQREKIMEKEKEQNDQELWDNYKKCNIHILGIPGGEK